MGNWHLKSKDVDLLYCVKMECNVITFRDSVSGICPKCHEHGSLVRTAKVLPLGVPNK